MTTTKAVIFAGALLPTFTITCTEPDASGVQQNVDLSTGYSSVKVHAGGKEDTATGTATGCTCTPTSTQLGALTAGFYAGNVVATSSAAGNPKRYFEFTLEVKSIAT